MVSTGKLPGPSRRSNPSRGFKGARKGTRRTRNDKYAGQGPSHSGVTANGWTLGNADDLYTWFTPAHETASLFSVNLFKRRGTVDISGFQVRSMNSARSILHKFFPPARPVVGWGGAFGPRSWDPLARKLAPVSAVIADIGARAAVCPP